MDRLELKLDESNELIFSVAIEGTTEKPSAVRFVCEGDDMGFFFNGETTSEPREIKVVIPAMEGRLKEGTYPGRLEVLIDGKYISPLQALVDFRPGLKVVVESVKRIDAAGAKPEVKTTASVIVKPKLSVEKPAVKVAGPPTLAERYKQRKA